jgi:hypothetical protein
VGVGGLSERGRPGPLRDSPWPAENGINLVRAAQTARLGLARELGRKHFTSSYAHFVFQGSSRESQSRSGEAKSRNELEKMVVPICHRGDPRFVSARQPGWCSDRTTSCTTSSRRARIVRSISSSWIDRVGKLKLSMQRCPVCASMKTKTPNSRVHVSQTWLRRPNPHSIPPTLTTIQFFVAPPTPTHKRNQKADIFDCDERDREKSHVTP